jgi:hypothetical protein
MRKSSLLVLSLLASVAACSGGGGGSPSGGATTQAAPPVAGATFDSTSGGTGTATVSSYSYGSNDAVGCCTSVNSSGASTVTMTMDPNGGPSTLQLNFSNEGGPGISHTYNIDNTNAAVVPFGGNAFATTDTDPVTGSTYNLIYAGASEPTLDVNNNPRTPSLSYTTYGMWSIANTDNSGSTGAFSAGQETTPGTAYPMPSATYTGGAIGSSYDSGSGIASQLTGTSSVAVNFGTGAVNGSLALTNANTGNPFDTVNLAGNIIGANGNKFNGATSGTTLVGATGQFAGSFYGPVYNELGGTWNLSNIAAGGTVSALGAFGAKR